MKIILICGGQGVKMWPLSREDKPKQFQKILGSKTLFEINLEVLLRRFSPKDIVISTKKRYAAHVEKLAPQIPLRNVFFEPDFRKNQGPGTLYAVLKLDYLYPGEPFTVCQADVLRVPDEIYLEGLKEIELTLEKTGLLLTGGQKVENAVMGADYIIAGKRQDIDTGLKVYAVEGFVMRPDTFEETEKLARRPGAYLHTNHYSWYPTKLLEATKENRPDWYEGLMKIREAFGKEDEERVTDEVYSQLEAGQIEAVTIPVLKENGGVMDFDFKWIDIGSWDSVYQYLPKIQGNASDANSLVVDSEGCLVKASDRKLVALLGVRDVVVVDSGDVILVVNRKRSGDLKMILEELEKKDMKKYL